MNDFPGDDTRSEQAKALAEAYRDHPAIEALLDEITAELARARAKFPGKNVTFFALVEEVGELAKAMFSEPRADVRKEAVQVAVMAMRCVLDGDHCVEPWRYMKGLDELVPRAAAEESAP